MIRYRLKLKIFLLFWSCCLVYILIDLGKPWDGFFIPTPTDTKPVWEDMRGKKMIEFVQPMLDTIILQPDNLASKIFENHVIAVIFVLSSSESLEQRNAIRNTWYTLKNQSHVEIIFMIGKQMNDDPYHAIIKNEMEIHGDILIDSLIESYYGLPTKILRAMKFYLQTFITLPKLPLFIKADDDAFLNLPNLISFLKSSAVSEKNFIAGHRVSWGKTNRGTKSRMYTPHNIWKGYWLPTYLWGPTYILSGDVVLNIYQKSLGMDYFPFEDVFLTGIVGHNELGLSLVHIPGMYETKDVTDDEMLKGAVLVHPFKTPKDLMDIYRRSKYVDDLTNLVGEFK